MHLSSTKLTRRAGLALAAVFILAASILPLAGCSGVIAKSGVATPSVNIKVEKYSLDNGLEVLLHKDDKIPIVAVNLWYHVGPQNEAEGRTGFAHLFEHMMFQGSAHTEDDSYFKHLENAGASLVNGTTDFDRTNYMEDVPSNQLELALWLESDRMGFLLEKVDAASLANQQDVVRNERRQAVENAPYGLPEEELFHLIFPEDHPYYAYVIGSHEDIQAAKLDDVHSFFKQYYAPNNASIAIVGNFDPKEAKALVEKYFGSIPAGPPVPPVEVETPPITAERRKVVTDKVELPRVYMAWLTAPIFKPGDAEADLAAQILGGGKASRLYESLVYDQKIAQDVNASQYSLTLGSVYQITATAKPGHTAVELEEAIDVELARFAVDGPTEAELSAAKNAILTDIITSLEQLGGFNGVANRINLYNHHLGDPNYLNKDLERYTKVTVDDVRAFAANALQRESRAIVHAEPGEKVLPPNPPAPPAPEKVVAEIQTDEMWRMEVPAPGPLPTTPLARADEFKLDNGLSVYLVENDALPVVAAQLVLRSGSSADPGNLPGLAAFTAGMLDEGTSSRDALQIARELDALGATLNTGSGTDATFMTLRSLKKNAENAMGIMSDVVLSPAFPDNEIERVRDDRVTAIIQEADSPVQTAIRVLLPALYGEDHPYGHVSSGTQEALARMTRDDLVGFYEGAFNPSNAALVLAGDLSKSEAKKLAESAFAAWEGSGAPTPKPQRGTRDDARVLIVDKPKAPQTLVILAQQALERSNPDFERFNIMNTVLGGLFTSRVNLNLREEHGYSYGAFSFMPPSRGVGALYVGAMVRADVTGPSVKEMLGEVEGMLEAEVTDEELMLAKESISRSLPALFETSQSTVGTIGNLFVYELPADYYEGLPGRLEELTAADVYEATQKHLKPDDMLVMAVGDRWTVQKQLDPLNLGKTAIRTPDGKDAGLASRN